MREIKFRAWNKKNKEFINSSNLVFRLDGFLFDRESEDQLYNIDLLQYTGLTDKNGKEIYEGDIIKNEFGKKIVKFENGSFYCDEEKNIMKVYFWSLDLNKIEIIGNIYENKELLNETNRKTTKEMETYTCKCGITHQPNCGCNGKCRNCGREIVRENKKLIT